MASAYKNIAKLVGSTGDVTIYTCPSETQAIVKNIQLYNSHSGTIVVYPKITESSAFLTVTLGKNRKGILANTSLPGPFVVS